MKIKLFLFIFMMFLISETKKIQALPSFKNMAVLAILIPHAYNYAYKVAPREFGFYTGMGISGSGLYWLFDTWRNSSKKESISDKKPGTEQTKVESPKRDGSKEINKWNYAPGVFLTLGGAAMASFCHLAK